MAILSKLNMGFERWLSRPEENIAGRLGLYRIIYALFHLWTLKHLNLSFLDSIPDASWQPMVLLHSLDSPPDVQLLIVMNTILVGALVLLVFGLFTRPVTLIVFVVGFGLEVVRLSFGKVNHATAFMTVFIPFFMLFSCWGSTYSIDAILRARRGKTTVDVHDSSYYYAWSARMIVVLLGIFFFSAGLIKLRLGQWTSDELLIPNLLLSHNVWATLYERYPNPLNVFIASSPFLYTLMRFVPLGFELGFPLANINRRFTNFFVAVAVTFHAFNYFFLNVSFLVQVITYLIFVDWQKLLDSIPKPDVTLKLKRIPSYALVGSVLLLTMSVMLTWNNLVYSPRQVLFLLTDRFLWFIVTIPALVIAPYLGIQNLNDIVQGGMRMLRSSR